MKQLSWKWGLLLVTVLAIAGLSPYLITGYFYDDSINSVLPTYLKLRNQTFAEFLASQLHGWAFVHARLYPLTVIVCYSVWQFLTELWAYRLLHVLLTLSNLILFAAMIRALGGGARLALTGALVALGLFQLRDYHDPISSYGVLMQMGLGLGAGALLLYSRALGWSLVLYACALLVYETELAFFPVFLFLAFRSWPAPVGFLARWGHVMVTVAYLGSVALLRLIGPTNYDGTQIKLSLRAISTFLFQFSAALPLSYPIFGRSGFYSAETLISPEFLTLQAFAMFVAGSFAFYLFLTRVATGPESPRKLPGALRVFGWSLALIPPLIVALSRKYQDEVNRPGIGYLPVYLSYFGIAILLAGVVTRSRRPRLVATVCGLVLATAFSANWIAAKRLNSYWKDPRVLFEKALAAGLFLEVKPEDRISFAQFYNWHSRELFIHHSGKVAILEPLTTAKNPYFLNIRVRSPGHGEVALGRVDDVKWNPKEPILPEQVLSSRPVKIVRIDGATLRTGFVQQPGLDLVSPQMWELPLK